MKFLLGVIFLFIASSWINAQEVPKIDYSFEKDTLEGAHGEDFIIPKNGISITNPAHGIDRDPTFRKCREFPDTNKRRRCFSKTFYGFLRNEVQHQKTFRNGETVEFLIQFTITKSGAIEDIIFIKSNDKTGDFEREMIRVIKKLPALEPGLIGGRPADIPFTFPIKFG